MKRLAILLSGRGSNFVAIANAIEAGDIPARIKLVLSNQPDAAGLIEARRRGYKALCVPSRGVERRQYDRTILKVMQQCQAEIICLAGFMRILSPEFVNHFPDRILNIHPSLLPAFPGLRAQRQALEWGVKVTGCSVHLVDEQLDHGPIIAQATVPVHADDTESSLASRILAQEHRIYPEALRLICQDRVRIEGRTVVVQPS